MVKVSCCRIWNLCMRSYGIDCYSQLNQNGWIAGMHYERLQTVKNGRVIRAILNVAFFPAENKLGVATTIIQQSWEQTRHEKNTIIRQQQHSANWGPIIVIIQCTLENLDETNNNRRAIYQPCSNELLLLPTKHSHVHQLTTTFPTLSKIYQCDYLISFL